MAPLRTGCADFSLVSPNSPRRDRLLPGWIAKAPCHSRTLSAFRDLCSPRKVALESRWEPCKIFSSADSTLKVGLAIVPDNAKVYLADVNSV